MAYISSVGEARLVRAEWGYVDRGKGYTPFYQRHTDSNRVWGLLTPELFPPPSTVSPVSCHREIHIALKKPHGTCRFLGDVDLSHRGRRNPELLTHDPEAFSPKIFIN